MNDKQINILLADDDSEQRNLLVQAILDCAPSVKITTADSGAALFRLLSMAQYDCLVLDCNMPPLGPSDIIAAPQVRESGSCVVAVSNSEDQSVVIDSLRGGAVDFVPKTDALQGSTLWTCVQNAIERKTRRDSERYQLQAKQQELELLARTDALTGLLNRRSFNERASQGRRRGDREMLGHILVDIDHFKAINDNCGHAAGDAVLSSVGQFIRSKISPHDHAFRWGGEEFLILLPSSGLGESFGWAEAFRHELSDLSIAIGDGQRLRVTSSIGVETVPTRDFGLHVVERADQAMYLAKRAGRNQVCTWPMVAVLDAIDHTSQLYGASVAQKRNNFLAMCGKTLSAVQKEHLTRHSEDVASLASDIARILGMPKQTVEHVYLAGLLHDLGKVLMPPDLLEKTTPLTPSDRGVIDRLPADSARLSEKLGADSETVQLIGQQWSGSDAYQRGKPGSFLRPVSGIVHAADAFVSLTADRAYRPRLSVESALSTLRSQGGTQFDAATLHALAGAVRRPAA